MKSNSRHKAYFQANQEAWNKKTEVHLNSSMYNLEAFKAGETSLCDLEADGANLQVKGKRVLHLQCHFGLDSMSLERMGADVTAVDFSDGAIQHACQIRDELGLATKFICCNIYDLPDHLDGTFDLIYSTYGTIGWLPDLEKWAEIVDHFLKPGGQLYLAEFHPYIWTMNDEYDEIGHYSYFFEKEPIVEDQEGTYADRKSSIKTRMYSWNHHLGEVLSSTVSQGLVLKHFEEFDYSPYACFPDLEEIGPRKYVFRKWGRKLPYFYILKMQKPV